MKKVLIITYYWPPSGGGGVQRWLKFVKYLRSFGWEPIVFTPKNPETPVDDFSLLKDIPKGIQVLKNKIWEPYTFYKSLTGKKKDKIQTAFLKEKEGASSLFESLSVWIRGNFFIPDARKFWISPSVSFLKNFLSIEKVDAVVSTGPPHSAHLIALHLKKELGVPWLADFRDPWTNIDYYHELKLGKRADLKHRRLEKLVLETADAVTVVSPGMIEDFKKISERKYHFIPNGFDAEDIKTLPDETSLGEKFSITHVGSLTRTRNPENLWIVLQEIIGESAEFAGDLTIQNIGKMDISVRDSLKNRKLNQFLRTTDYLPHDQVILAQRKTALLLLLINNTPNANLILTGKIFEYLAARRPILCIAPPDGDAAAIIKETNCGSVFGFDEKHSLKTEIIKSYQLFKQGKLCTNCNNIDQFERKNLTGRMAEVLNGLIS